MQIRETIFYLQQYALIQCEKIFGQKKLSLHLKWKEHQNEVSLEFNLKLETKKWGQKMLRYFVLLIEYEITNQSYV